MSKPTTLITYQTPTIITSQDYINVAGLPTGADGQQIGIDELPRFILFASNDLNAICNNNIFTQWIITDQQDANYLSPARQYNIQLAVIYTTQYYLQTGHIFATIEASTGTTNVRSSVDRLEELGKRQDIIRLLTLARVFSPLYVENPQTQLAVDPWGALPNLPLTALNNYYLNLAGTIPMQGALNMSNFGISNIANLTGGTNATISNFTFGNNIQTTPAWIAYLKSQLNLSGELWQIVNGNTITPNADLEVNNLVINGLDYTTTLNGAVSNINTLIAEVQVLNTTINNEITNLSNLEAIVVANNTSINNINNEVTTINNEITTINNEITTINEDIAKLGDITTTDNTFSGTNSFDLEVVFDQGIKVLGGANNKGITFGDFPLTSIIQDGGGDIAFNAFNNLNIDVGRLSLGLSGNGEFDAYLNFTNNPTDAGAIISSQGPLALATYLGGEMLFSNEEAQINITLTQINTAINQLNNLLSKQQQVAILSGNGNPITTTNGNRVNLDNSMFLDFKTGTSPSFINIDSAKFILNAPGRYEFYVNFYGNGGNTTHCAFETNTNGNPKYMAYSQLSPVMTNQNYYGSTNGSVNNTSSQMVEMISIIEANADNYVSLLIWTNSAVDLVISGIVIKFTPY